MASLTKQSAKCSCYLGPSGSNVPSLKVERILCLRTSSYCLLCFSLVSAKGYQVLGFNIEKLLALGSPMPINKRHLDACKVG